MKYAKIWRLFAAFLIVFSAFFSTESIAQERSATLQGFTFPAGQQSRILILRPSIKVGAQSTGGLFEPNADWTNQARDFIGQALSDAQASLGNQAITVAEPVGPQAQLLHDYSALFNVVASSVIQYQFFPGNRLDTKKRDIRAGAFEWSLGEGVRNIPGAEQADYALFITTEDHYGSTGRKVLQLFAALGGVSVTSGVHRGYAGLVDLRTGNLVWINADDQMGGDVRTADGARRRVSQLLEGLPGRIVAPVTATPSR